MPETLRALFYLTLTLLKGPKSQTNIFLDILCSKVFDKAWEPFLTNVEDAIVPPVHLSGLWHSFPQLLRPWAADIALLRPFQAC